MVKRYIKIEAGELRAALLEATPVKRRKPKPIPVSIEFYEPRSELSIVEAHHGKFQKQITVKGRWFQSVQVDGSALLRVVSTYEKDDILELIEEKDHLVIVRGASRLKMPRIDNSTGNKIERGPEPQNSKHKGKPQGADNPIGSMGGMPADGLFGYKR